VLRNRARRGGATRLYAEGERTGGGGGRGVSGRGRGGGVEGGQGFCSDMRPSPNSNAGYPQGPDPRSSPPPPCVHLPCTTFWHPPGAPGSATPWLMRREAPVPWASVRLLTAAPSRRAPSSDVSSRSRKPTGGEWLAVGAAASSEIGNARRSHNLNTSHETQD